MQVERHPTTTGALLIISHSRQFVMLAPWKTASQTLHASLEPYNESRYQRSFYFNGSLGRVVHQHITLSDYLALPEGALEYKLGAFVRNPYDRAYSGFIQIQRDFQDQPRTPFEPWVSELVKTQISENMARVIKAGFDFNAWITALPEYEVFDSGRNTNMPLHPAHYWTHVEGRKTADFVGRVENFEEDLRSFCELVGIGMPAIRIENASRVEPTPEISYSRYAGRMSRYALDRINELFVDDFELFGYEML